MNKLLLGTAVLLAGCTAQMESERVLLDLGDVEDYAEFLEEQGEIEEPLPFQPEPLYVSAVGKVQAQPDIAVITATITATDKNESRAVEEMGVIINAVQSALSGREIETGFTAITSERKFDETCLNENNFAWRRHNEIVRDYNFNRNLDLRGDTETKRRPDKPRVAQQVCAAQEIKVATQMVIRIQPPEAAGDALRALSNAGAENARLFGYDFTDYDALYQDAAAKAVTLAREKAETVARVSGAILGEIESFSVSTPERTGRFGPQPNVIRPANRYRGQEGSVVDRYVDEDLDYEPPYRASNRASQSRRERLDGDEDVIIVTASKRATENPRSPSPVGLDGFLSETPPLQGSAVPEFTDQTYVSVTDGDAGGNTNALSISLLSGPQTISVAARLGYTYDTPLNGKIIIDPDD